MPTAVGSATSASGMQLPAVDSKSSTRYGGCSACPMKRTNNCNAAAPADASYCGIDRSYHGRRRRHHLNDDDNCGSTVIRDHCPPVRERTMRCGVTGVSGVNVDIPLPAVRVNVPCKVKPEVEFNQHTAVSVQPSAIKVEVPFAMKNCCGIDFETCVAVDFDPICLDDACGGDDDDDRGCASSSAFRRVPNDAYDSYFDGLSASDFHREADEEEEDDDGGQAEADGKGKSSCSHYRQYSGSAPCCRPDNSAARPICRERHAGRANAYFDTDDYPDYDDDDEQQYQTFDSEADLNGWNSSDADEPDFYSGGHQKISLRPSQKPGAEFANHGMSVPQRSQLSQRLAQLHSHLVQLKEEWPSYVRDALRRSPRQNEFVGQWLGDFRRTQGNYRKAIQRLSQRFSLGEGNAEEVAHLITPHLEELKSLRQSVLGYVKESGLISEPAFQRLYDKLTASLNTQIRDFRSLYQTLVTQVTPR